MYFVFTAGRSFYLYLSSENIRTEMTMERWSNLVSEASQLSIVFPPDILTKLLKYYTWLDTYKYCIRLWGERIRRWDDQKVGCLTGWSQWSTIRRRINILHSLYDTNKQKHNNTLFVFRRWAFNNGLKYVSSDFVLFVYRCSWCVRIWCRYPTAVAHANSVGFFKLY
jgi:hypothetical protein